MLLRILRWMNKPKKAKLEKQPDERSDDVKPERKEKAEEKDGTLKMRERVHIPVFYEIYRRIYTERLKKDTRMIILLMIIFSFVAFKSLRVIGILLGLIVVAALSKLIQEPIPFVVGLDLCLFVTVVVGHTIHPFVGLLVGGTASFIGSLLRSHQEADTMLIPLAGYLWVSILVALVRSNLSLFHAGLASTLLYSFHNAIVFGKIRHFSIHTFTFLFTAIPFNILLFSHLGPGLVSLLS